jgi:hypothetical protein
MSKSDRKRKKLPAFTFNVYNPPQGDGMGTVYSAIVFERGIKAATQLLKAKVGPGLKLRLVSRTMPKKDKVLLVGSPQPVTWSAFYEKLEST